MDALAIIELLALTVGAHATVFSQRALHVRQRPRKLVNAYVYFMDTEILH
jgi:hypothetical protein